MKNRVAFSAALLLVWLAAIHADEPLLLPLPFHESFGPDFDTNRFANSISNKGIWGQSLAHRAANGWG
ncbi:MAG: hypothetical protein WCL08_07480 [Verrucomicrobiota bacterium]